MPRPRRSPPSPGSQRGRQALGGHQAAWIWGRNLVRETLQARVWPVLELCLADDLPAAEAKLATQLASQAGIPVTRATRPQLVSRCRGEDHQGYAARMAEFPYHSLAEVCSPVEAGALPPLLVALDRIQDPFNFGTMLRSAEIFGARGVLIGETEQVGVTSQVARSSVGAVNRVPICRVRDLAVALADPVIADYAIVAASEKADSDVDRTDLKRPVVLVVGNEGHGISPTVLQQCGLKVRIPQEGQVNSLNAAAALAIICYEIRRQQRNA